MEVVKHQQDRCIRGQLSEQRGNRVEQSITPALRACTIRRALAGLARQARNDRLQIGRPRLHAAAELIRRGDDEKVPERHDEVLVGNQQILVGRAVQHHCSVLACLEGELARQAALADSSLAHHQRDARAVSRGDVRPLRS